MTVLLDLASRKNTALAVIREDGDHDPSFDPSARDSTRGYAGIVQPIRCARLAKVTLAGAGEETPAAEETRRL